MKLLKTAALCLLGLILGIFGLVFPWIIYQALQALVDILP